MFPKIHFIEANHFFIPYNSSTNSNFLIVDHKMTFFYLINSNYIYWKKQKYLRLR